MLNLRLPLSAIFIAVLLPALVFAQPTTKDPNTKTTQTSTTPKDNKKKILVVPWEPKMFNCNSDITRAISSESGEKYDQIEVALRKGFIEEIKHSFGATCTVTSLMDDTAKMKYDLHNAYAFTTLSYTPVNSPLNPTHADSLKMKQAPSGTNKGQVTTSEDETDRFMNTVVIHPGFLSYLKTKYGCDYILFVNELDLDNDLGADPYNYGGKEEFQRMAIVHWTMFDASNSTRIAAGKTKANFSSKSNSTRKITDGPFKTLADAIYNKYLVAIKPKQ